MDNLEVLDKFQKCMIEKEIENINRPITTN